MTGNFICRHHVEPRVKFYSSRESFPIPLKYIDQNYSHEFGCQARATHRWFLEYRRIKRFVRSLDRFHSTYSTWRETSRQICVVQEKKMTNGRSQMKNQNSMTLRTRNSLQERRIDDSMILGQVSLSLLCWKKTSKRIYVVRSHPGQIISNQNSGSK